MNQPQQWPRREEPGKRRSTKVALVLLGTTGAVGLGALAYEAWQNSRPDDNSAWGSGAARVPISTGQSYANNDFIPGVGYYHAPYHGWYPYAYNYHDPARGYFAGGLWAAVPFAIALARSQPSADAVAAALAARRIQEQKDQQQRSSSHIVGNSGSGGWFSSRSSSSPSSGAASHSSVQRGGFGSSSHHSGT